jgi:3-deoxy-7-phosphoheptulonate synthase
LIIIVKKGTPKETIAHFTDELRKQNFGIHLSEGENTTIIGLIGDTYSLDIDKLKAVSIVEEVRRVTEPFKKPNRKFHELDTVVDISGRKIGGGHFLMIAGPCSVESDAQISEITKSITKSGANMLRGGAYKPRTSPYAFQGLEEEGLSILVNNKKRYSTPIISEIMDVSDIDSFAEVDVIQVGARNMQNFRLLKELGKLKQPILLKRGLANTIEELLMSAEYIMSGGNENIILCERGIRTFETYTRNTLDVSAIPVLKKISHLPVVADPSHAAGHEWLVEPLAKAAIAAGADGLMIEVHNDPENALSDGMQSLTPERFGKLMKTLKAYIDMEGKFVDYADAIQ